MSFTFSVSGHTDGVMYDAMRMEITNTSADPTTTGWEDYTYINGSAQTAPNDAHGLAASQSFSPQAPSLTWNNAGGSGDGSTWDIGASQNWNNGTTVAYYTDAANVTLNDANSGNYNLALNTTVSPGSTLINANGNYTISGSGGMAGYGGLTKLGSGTLTLNVNNTYSGATNINAGTVVAGVAGALSYGSVSVSSVANLTLAQNIGTVNMRSLTIGAGGTVDITNNPLAIYYGSNADPVAAIRGYLQSAYNGGVWTGTGLTSSTVRAQVAGALANGGGVYAIGYADGNVDNTTIATANQIVIMPALVGDANLDGSVSFIDLGIVAQNLGATNSDWMHGDFNYDGSVNFLDIALLAQNLNMTTLNTPLGAEFSPAFLAQWKLAVAEIEANGGATSVPEPGMLGLVAGAGMMMMRRRGRSKYPLA
jgi:autotransporter-associated beta strand protein